MLQNADTPLPIELPGEPALVYQPAVDLATGLLLGFEVFVRWIQPDSESIRADVLVPWAEASNNVTALDRWVITEACKEAQRWPSGMQVAVNCSVEDFRQKTACSSIQHALELSSLNPDLLTVEVSEDTISDSNSVEELRRLSSFGIHLAVDDVGTRWSSLRPFKDLNVDTVKIDGSFISGLESDAGMNRCVVEALLQVSHSLSMSAIAEKIETARQVAILKEFGVDIGQGFFFAYPLSVEQARKLANAESRPIFSLGTDNNSTVRHVQDVQPMYASASDDLGMSDTAAELNHTLAPG